MTIAPRAEALARPVAFGLMLAATACAAHVPHYSGTVQTESVAVGSQSGGRIVQVMVEPGSRVKRGAVLLRLDSAELDAQRAQYAAQAQAAADRLADLESGSVSTDIERARAQSAQAAAQYRQTVVQSRPQIDAAQAAIRDASAAAQFARSSLERIAPLAATGDVSRQSLDQARADDRRAQARLAQTQAAYRQLVGAQLPGERSSAQANAIAQNAQYQTVSNGARRNQIAEAGAQLSAARAAERYAAARLREVTVVAPADGIVESFNLHAGDLLAPNQTAAIVDLIADPYTYVYASQRDLTALAPGRRLRVVSDAGGAVYDARVESQDRTAQFTPQNVETADQRGDLVFGVKLRIRDPRHALLSGTTITATPL